MDIALPVLGGLGLFLYGMNIMGTGLQKAAGEKLKKLIEVLTNNRLMGVVVGALVTMVIQSSSATTVMVIGFVNAGLMSLYQAAGVIMGANIGTTVTAQLIAFKLTDYAPLAVAIGVGIWMTTSKKKSKNIAEILIGFGILFIGMDMMGNGLKPLADLPAFTNIMVRLNNPVLGMLVGLGLTTIVQSSSASIGLLQALAGQGLLDINIAFPILFGDNIGTTTTAMISSVGANRTAKRAAIIHFLFNLIGTIIFMTILRIPIQKLVTKISPNDIQRQIANAHTLFNLLNVAIQLPFAGLLVKAAKAIVPGDDRVEIHEAKFLDFRIIETPSIALGQVRKEIARMGNYVEENLGKAQRAFVEGKYEEIEPALEQEQKINKLQREITDYLVRLSNAPLSDEEHKQVNVFFNNVNDIERVGDHAENIVELAEERMEGNLQFTEDAIEELNEIFGKCQLGFQKAMEAFKTNGEALAKEVLAIEDEVDELESKNRTNHIDRLNKGLCSTGPGIIFLDAISNLERVSDHCSNIALYVLDNYKTKPKNI
ncbi:Na/Pi cotransporter family protein [Tissierella sp.]|uniref:Na/Pi cotransporter family protein n=1 Tax=Tissierella sp. TaxID=41274 RepID=UPI0028B09AD3|nr:Na/Pi cotransporter family protein [Tissierella sp.]